MPVFLFLSMTACWSSSPPPAVVNFDQGDNGVWLRRVWLHSDPLIDGQESDRFAELAKSSRELGVTRLYPFLGPMDAEGWPGWRGENGIHRYDIDRAGQFFDAMSEAYPEAKVIPWTGGVYQRDVKLGDSVRIAGFIEHASKLTQRGAHGIQLNVEPLPSFAPGYLEFLSQVKVGIGPGKILSVAAYPPTTPLHPFEDVHWTPSFSVEVCLAVDEYVVMAYDTALTQRADYRSLVKIWTLELAASLPAPEDGGCKFLIGVPAYEDDEPWHRPDIEVISEAIRGVNDAFLETNPPKHFRGIAVYASWTTDRSEWESYQRLWRGEDGVRPMPDFEMVPVESSGTEPTDVK